MRARVIQIQVDLTDAPRNLVYTRVQLPVRPGETAIFTSPVWIQESHTNNGPVASIAGLCFTAGSTTLRWYRNPAVVSEYQVDVPSDVDTIVATFEAVVTRKVTRRMMMLCWEHVLFYPARRHVEAIPVQASIITPAAWKLGTSLQNLGTCDTTFSADGLTKTSLYPPTDVCRLEDCPVLTGQYFAEWTLNKRHILCVTADTEEYAIVPREVLDKLELLVAQTWTVFGARHYETFRFLVALTDYWPSPGGIEHHDSFDVSLPRKSLSDVRHLRQNGSVLAHEFVHSWNGKYRRPAGHLPHDFATPLDGRLLWVYEGLTEYYGGVLSVRSGIMLPEAYHAELAQHVAYLDGQTGRQWRSTEDTGTGSSLRPSPAWANWLHSGQDYYLEGVLVWLDVDTLIRSKSGGRRSLDNLARSFFGQGTITGPEVVPYTLADLVAALNEVVAYDWQAFFQTKVLDVSPEVNVAGIERAGYEFVWTDEPESQTDGDKAIGTAIWNSIGIRAAPNGLIIDVRRGSHADTAAKLAPGQTIVKVGGVEFSYKAFAAEIKSKQPVRLRVSQQDEEWDVVVHCRDGLRYPRVQFKEGADDMLSTILATREPSSAWFMCEKALSRDGDSMQA